MYCLAVVGAGLLTPQALAYDGCCLAKGPWPNETVLYETAMQAASVHWGDLNDHATERRVDLSYDPEVASSDYVHDAHFYGEEIVGTNSSDKITGTHGNDSVFSRGGDDTIVGGQGRGDDYYDGGEGIDVIRYPSAVNPVTVNLKNGTAFGIDIDNDTLVNIENVSGGTGDDNITGDDNSNVLAGDKGNDVINGLGSADTIEGGLGNDIVDGGADDDTYIYSRGDGDDIISDSGIGALDIQTLDRVLLKNVLTSNKVIFVAICFLFQNNASLSVLFRLRARIPNDKLSSFIFSL